MFNKYCLLKSFFFWDCNFREANDKCVLISLCVIVYTCITTNTDFDFLKFVIDFETTTCAIFEHFTNIQTIYLFSSIFIFGFRYFPLRFLFDTKSARLIQIEVRITEEKLFQ